MHLNFDTTPSKPGRTVVQDESGNKNDAGLANGAEISNRTMGMVLELTKSEFLEAFFSNVAGFRKARCDCNHLFCIGFNSNLDSNSREAVASVWAMEVKSAWTLKVT